VPLVGCLSEGAYDLSAILALLAEVLEVSLSFKLNSTDSRFMKGYMREERLEARR